MTSKERAFDEWLRGLSKPVQDNIRDGIMHGESFSQSAFLAGWEARGTDETNDELTEAKRLLDEALWHHAETDAATASYQAIRKFLKLDEPQPVKCGAEKADADHCQCRWDAGKTRVVEWNPACQYHNERITEKTSARYCPHGYELEDLRTGTSVCHQCPVAPEHLLKQGYRSGREEDPRPARPRNRLKGAWRDPESETDG